VLPPTTTTTAPPGLPLPLSPGPVRIAWAGDSVAYTLASAVAAEANVRGVQVVDRSTPGCGMLRGFPADENLVPYAIVSACDRAIPGNRGITAGSGADVVTWLSTWEDSNRVVDGVGYVFGTPEADAKLLELIDEAVQQLTSRGARLVFLVNPPPTSGPMRPEIDPAAVARGQHLGALLRRYASEHADRVGLIDLTPIVCPTGPPCPTEVDGVTLRPTDGGHFGADGAAYVASRLLDQLMGPA
jgi:lysophospholipase L1-like esterase